MRYQELTEIDPSKRLDAVRKLTPEQFADLKDETPYTLPALKKDQPGKYFDSVDDFYRYALHHLVPATRPWEAAELANHEFAHADCALKLGAVGVAYVALDSIDMRNLNQAHVVPYGPIRLPRIAFAAISMHPFDAERSIEDMRGLLQDRYPSREYVAQRIARWNERLGDELEIPMPQSGPLDATGHIN